MFHPRILRKNLKMSHHTTMKMKTKKIMTMKTMKKRSRNKTQKTAINNDCRFFMPFPFDAFAFFLLGKVQVTDNGRNLAVSLYNGNDQKKLNDDDSSSIRLLEFFASMFFQLL